MIDIDHIPTLSVVIFICFEHGKQFMFFLKRLEVVKKRMNRILAENTGKSIEQVTADCERDNFMSAQEALEYGLIDRVIEKR